ncbi:MAG: hypothetical protein JW910_02215 [Anaerolineae bacterium]|nr:hypothetical protein [Anaerolineae bacterium]
MDRTVPKTGSEEIELYIRTYYSLLRSTRPIRLHALVESHMNMESSLHIHARNPQPDISALVYASLRLPLCIREAGLVVLGQSDEVFSSGGYGAVPSWRRVSARGRRRRMHFDGSRILAVYIASRSDIDDLIPTLTAYQIEWNKLHNLLQGEVLKLFLAHHRNRRDPLADAELKVLADALNLTLEDIQRLQAVWDADFMMMLADMAAGPKNISLQLLAGSLMHYRKATSRWWDALVRHAAEHDIKLRERPVYFVSSNTHSLPNLLTGFARRWEADLLAYLHEKRHQDLLAEYEAISTRQDTRNHNNLLYYVQKKYLQDCTADAWERIAAEEQGIGLYRITSERGFDVEAQVIDLARLRLDWVDERLSRLPDLERLHESNAIILNIDYPLGLAAYELLNEVAYQTGALLGVYVMGKAATLNGRIGDVMLPNVVHDEHSQNTYLIGNCFTAGDVAPYLTDGTVLDNQKAISARGTFLQNPRYMDVFYREGYTIIEMEAGPYLSGIYEAVRPKRHPTNEIVYLYGTPFDVGFLHYASDTPMTKGHNLGAGSLSYAGVDPTYGAAVAILRRIFAQEVRRLQGEGGPQPEPSALSPVADFD